MTESAAGTDVDHVRACERRLLDPAVRADAETLERLLHPDFVEFGSSGSVWTRTEMIAALVADSGARVEAVGMIAAEVAPGAVLLTYEATGSHRRSLRSSLWVRSEAIDEDDLGWRLRFHQGTVVP